MYERRNERLLPRPLFARRVLLHILFATSIIVIGLGIGILGYHFLAGFLWIDSFLNAAMILGGMGPVNALTDSASKIFAGVYALFAGLVFIGVAGIMFTPFLHRLMHRFHIDDEGS